MLEELGVFNFTRIDWKMKDKGLDQYDSQHCVIMQYMCSALRRGTLETPCLGIQRGHKISRYHVMVRHVGLFSPFLKSQWWSERSKWFNKNDHSIDYMKRYLMLQCLYAGEIIMLIGEDHDFDWTRWILGLELRTLETSVCPPVTRIPDLCIFFKSKWSFGDFIWFF